MGLDYGPGGLAGVVMKKILLAGVAALFVVPAVAADLPTKKAIVLPVVSEYDWTGFYFGGNLGWSWTHTDYNSYAYNITRPTAAAPYDGYPVDSGSYSSSQFNGGGQIGYRYMFPQRFVIGAEANLNWNAGSSTTISNLTGTNFHESSSSGIGGRIVGIAGYAWGDYLPYIKGGWAWSNQNITRTQLYGTTGGLAPQSPSNQTTFQEDATVNRNGWTIGAGLSYHFWNNWEAFGQYMYTKYDNAKVAYLLTQRLSNTSVNANSLTFGVNLKF